MSSLNQESNKFAEIIKRSDFKDGNPAQYHLQTSTDISNQSEPYRKVTFGERDKNKPNKTILMVGETGSGKTTLINVMINYMLDVKREDKVWFEITDDQSDQTSVYTRTTSITVYGFYLQDSRFDLTIIDTPGYGDTRGTDHDKKIAMNLFSLSESSEVINEIDAVCLVIDASQNRLSDRQLYIFDAVQSLFGRDIAENIVLLLTHSTGTPPKNALTAVKEAKIKCAVNDKNQPVFFLFNNRQSDTADEEEDDEEYKMRQEQSWSLSFKGMSEFVKFLDTIIPKSLKMSRDDSCQQKLEANIFNLKQLVQSMEEKQNKLKQIHAALKQDKEYVRNNKNFEDEVEVSYKEKADIAPAVAEIMTCTICEENCHYPGDSKMCDPLKDDHCTICTKKCHYSKHVKETKIYVTKTKKEKRTNEDLQKQYDGKIENSMSENKKLEEELQQLEKEKIKLVNEGFDCVENLQKITLNIDSVIILQHIDYLIDMLKEINEPEKAKTLENIKTAGREKSMSSGNRDKKKKKCEKK